MYFDGRHAVVIGGGSGIGRGIALGLADDGAGVTVADIDRESADAVAREIAARGRPGCAAQVDSTDRDSLRALADAAIRERGAIHILVNTVGAILDRPLAECTDADWAWLLDVNLMAQVGAADAFLPHLRCENGLAHIVLTSSMGGLVALGPEQSRGFHAGIYTATKHALIGYAEMLRMELAPRGIGVSVLLPTRVEGRLAATSARHRPARYGGPVQIDDRPASPDLKLMPAEEVGPIVVRAIRSNVFHIFTDPAPMAGVEERHQRLLGDAAFLASNAARS